MGGTEASSKNAAVSGGTVTIIPDSQVATGGIQTVTVESIKRKNVTFTYTRIENQK